MSEEAFLVFYAQTVRPLRGYLSRMLGDVSLVEDVLQESYFRLLRANLPPNMTDAHRKNYLFRTATNLVRDEGRRRKPVALEECQGRGTHVGERGPTAGCTAIPVRFEAARARIVVACLRGTVQPSRHCRYCRREAAEHPADAVAGARTPG